ncbi:protein translocase subunit SecD [Aeromicrobium wangtongii]|uniref:protein translocase subunit SecD n=1 Tax=Aeromicrobium wangtongii TaxID=2969247 RepID=UPI0020178A2B|nr:protein translocase subunit SecD [Aeromicrobium wangtongii]MCL3819086.1 protein translocase subunit SecD [Aeromicrobium wangtongii]
MATSSKRSPNRARPGRTLSLFLAAIVALYALVALIGITGDKGDDSPWHPKLGLDLEGGTRITFQAKAESGDITAEKLEQARDIIDQRVNASGVAEAEVTTQGGNQIIVEIPGEKRANIVDEVGKTAQLRFRLVWAGGLTSATTPATPADVAAQQKIIDDLDWSKLSLDQIIAAETSGVASLPAEYQPGIAALQKEAAGFVCTPDGIDVNDIADKPLVTCDTKTGEVEILSPTVIKGTDVSGAEAVVPQGQVSWVVSLKLKGEGKKTFSAVTDALYKQLQAGNTQGSKFAVVLDGEILTSPTTNGHFTNGESQISGDFNGTTAKTLANQLKYGALPLTFSVNGSEEIGPSLAGTQLDAGLAAGVIGLVLVVVYCLLYYRGLGLVIIGSLFVAAALTYVMVLLLGRGVGFTLTLPGIAGLIVAIGITADSFIVFFERLRDEVRDGKSLRLAVEAGWVRARGTILAADTVSIIAAVTLFIFAIGVVRGFAFALGLTTLIDVFVVFFFTKPLVSLLARTKFFGQGHRLSGLDAAHLGISGRKVTEIARTREEVSTSGKGL